MEEEEITATGRRKPDGEGSGGRRAREGHF